jgi:hypothetical protein
MVGVKSSVSDGVSSSVSEADSVVLAVVDREGDATWVDVAEAENALNVSDSLSVAMSELVALSVASNV